MWWCDGIFKEQQNHFWSFELSLCWLYFIYWRKRRIHASIHSSSYLLTFDNTVPRKKKRLLHTQESLKIARPSKSSKTFLHLKHAKQEEVDDERKRSEKKSRRDEFLIFFLYSLKEWTVGKVFHSFITEWMLWLARCVSWTKRNSTRERNKTLFECSTHSRYKIELSYQFFLSFRKKFRKSSSSSSRHQESERRQKTTTLKLTSKHGNLSFYCDAE